MAKESARQADLETSGDDDDDGGDDYDDGDGDYDDNDDNASNEGSSVLALLISHVLMSRSFAPLRQEQWCLGPSDVCTLS